MQNWKIKRMSTRRINQWLSAIGKLLKNYEGKVEIKGCPLCFVSPAVGCNTCLWKIIEGEDCFQFARRNNFDIPKRKSKRWRTLRIPMLKNWKKIFKAELARRFE